MVRKYFKKAMKTRRRYRNRRRPSNVVNLTRAPSSTPLPTSIITKHKYYDGISLGPTALSTDTHIFRANSLFDPDYTGSGHQPMGFDEMSAFYNHYVVIGSKITVKFQNQNDLPYTLMIELKDTATTTTNYAGPERNATSVLMGDKDGSNSRTTLTKHFSLKKFFNQKTNDNDQFWGLPTTDPSEQAFYHVTMLDTTNTVSATSYGTVTIEFIAKWFEPKPLGPS